MHRYWNLLLRFLKPFIFTSSLLSLVVIFMYLSYFAYLSLHCVFFIFKSLKSLYIFSFVDSKVSERLKLLELRVWTLEKTGLWTTLWPVIYDTWTIQTSQWLGMNSDRRRGSWKRLRGGGEGAGGDECRDGHRTLKLPWAWVCIREGDWQHVKNILCRPRRE